MFLLLQEELEKILLREQNKRLAERLRTLQKTHEELVDRNDALTTQHQQDERALFLTFRFWNQVLLFLIYLERK